MTAMFSRLLLCLHEGLVDLDPVERKAPEVAQARIAGSEIVKRQAHAERFQCPQAAQRLLGVVDEDAFGDLKLEQPCVEPRAAEDAREQVGQPSVTELDR